MENERNGFSIIGFIAQVLVILLFVFVLMWFFPTKSYLENNNGSINSNDNALNETLLNQNLLAMKDAGREYFTISRMPAKNGEEVILTLEEMLKKSMVVDLVDADGKKCDIKTSYIKVTKIDKEYEMIVTLTCSGITKTIKTTIGCYDYCTSNLCEQKTPTEIITKTLYQYKKVTEGTSKWSDWSKWSKTKVTATSTRQVETKEEEIKETKIEITDAKVSTSYRCPDGYTLANDTKTCYKNTSKTESIAATKTPVYSCPDGYEPSIDNKRCTKSTTSYITPKYVCSKSGVSAFSSDKKTCFLTEEPRTLIGYVNKCDDCGQSMPEPYLSCSHLGSGFTLNGDKCIGTLMGTTRFETVPSCSHLIGYKLTNSKTSCYKLETDYIDSSVEYNLSCDQEGYNLSNDGESCIKLMNLTETKEPNVINSYYCITGFLNNKNKCEKTIESIKQITYYRFRTLESTTGQTLTKWSESKNDQKLIKQGYKFTGVTKKVTSK